MRELQLPGGPTTIINCHPTKNATDDNLLPRGAGAFLAEVDGNLTRRKQQRAARPTRSASRKINCSGSSRPIRKPSMADLAKEAGWLTNKLEPYKMKAQRTINRLKRAKLIAVERGEYLISEKGSKVLKKLKEKHDH